MGEAHSTATALIELGAVLFGLSLLGRLAWRVGIGSDLGRLHAAADEIGRQPDGSAVLDVPCGGGVALRGLRRAITTAQLALDACERHWVPVRRSWRLNERHYGALQGLDKAETTRKFGPEQVLVWRRSYGTPPPALEADDPRSERSDVRYAKLSPEQIPLTECLKDTVERFLPFWESDIAPAIKRGERVIIAAHGNSLRALV